MGGERAMTTAWRHLFCVTDIEGVAGVDSWEQTRVPGSRLEAARVLATAEVNALVGALLDTNGVAPPRVSVWDGHGYGGLDLAAIDPRAVAYRYDDARGFPGLLRELVRGDLPVDALLFLGQHAMEGSGGTLAHTFSSRRIRSYTLNGSAIGEFGVRALFAWSLARIPTIFHSGDDIACDEARRMVPGILTAQVKRSLGLTAADSLPHDQACRLVASTASQVHGLRPDDARLQPRFLPEPPYTLQKRYKLKFGLIPRPPRTVSGPDLAGVLEKE
jgi:D-amino peptidase